LKIAGIRDSCVRVKLQLAACELPQTEAEPVACPHPKKPKVDALEVAVKVSFVPEGKLRSQVDCEQVDTRPAPALNTLTLMIPLTRLIVICNLIGGCGATANADVERTTRTIRTSKIFLIISS